jgi:hypothetical protein
MFTWAHIKDDDLVIDWEEVNRNLNMFERGHRNKDAEMGKLLSIIQRMCFERGFEEGVKANGLRQLLYETGGNG